MMKPTEVHKTANLYEGSYCLCVGLKLVGKERNGKKVQVHFEGPNANEKALEFYNGAKVEAKKLTDAYRTLKDYVFEN